MGMESFQSSMWIQIFCVIILSVNVPTKQSQCTQDCSTKLLDSLSKERNVTRAIKYRHRAIAFLFNVKFEKVVPINRPLFEMEAVIRQKLGVSWQRNEKKTTEDADVATERKQNMTEGPTITKQNLNRGNFDEERKNDSQSPIPDLKSTNEGVKNISSPLVKCSHVGGYSEHRWFLQVVKCPESWTNSTIRNLCEYWDSLQVSDGVGDVVLLPVQDNAGMVYANIYCSVCNGVKLIHPWEKFVRCDSDLIKEHVKWPMVDDLFSSYNAQNTENCQTLILPWKPESIVDCSTAFHEKKSLLRNSRNLKHSMADATNFPVSFNMLLNFDFTGNGHLLFSAGQTVIQEDMCESSETYDTYSNRCRPISCSRTHRLENGQCVALGDDPDQMSWSYDDVDQLPLLEDIAVVTLMANITFGDYVLYTYNTDENNTQEMKNQIQESLNITSDRISHFNITFKFGSMKGSAVQVSKLTKEEYEKLLSQDESDDVNIIGDSDSGATEGQSTQDGESKSSSDASDVSTTGEPDVEALEERFNQIDNQRHGSDQELPTRSSLQHTTEEEGSLETVSENADISERETGEGQGTVTSKKAKGLKVSKKGYYNPVPVSLTKQNPHKEDEKNENYGKAEKLGSWQKVDGSEKYGDVFSKYNTDLSDRSAGGSQRMNTLKLGGDETLSFQMVVGENNTEELKVFLSEPYNGAEERFILRTPIENAVYQPMVMIISFVLLPSDNPKEQKSRTLAEKITELVIERELHLQFSGKDITVVDSKHDIDDSEEAFCRWGKKYMVFDEEFTIITVDNDTVLYVNKTDTYNPIGMFDLWVMISGNNIEDETNFTLFRQYAFVCLMPQIKQKDCRRIEVTKDEYQTIGSNKSIIFEENEYDIYSYKVLNETTGSIAICVPQGYDEYEQQNLITIENGCGSEFMDVMRADGYLTIVLGRLSATALVLVLITYCLFKKFRNLPGMNTINLTLTLLIAQVVFTEGIMASPPWLCSAVAITEHFTRLAAQFWMNVISYDMYQTFSKPTVSTLSGDKRKRIIKYNLYAWGVPLLIVGICALIDFSDLFPGVYINYGGNKGISSNGHGAYQRNSTPQHHLMTHMFKPKYDNEIASKTDPSNETSDLKFNLPYTKATCWIGNSLATLLAFGAPIFIILITNCVFFVRTIINISHTSKLNKKRLTQRSSDSSVTNATGRADVMLYIRMSTVMGLTWVFAFTWSIASSFAQVNTKVICIVVLSQGILSTIFNVSQGIFIFVAFVCNRKVFSLYKDLFARGRKRIPSNIPKSRLYSVSSNVSSTSTVSSGISSSRTSSVKPYPPHY